MDKKIIELVENTRKGFLDSAWEQKKAEYIEKMRGLSEEITKALDAGMEFYETVSVCRFALRLMEEETDYMIRWGGFHRSAGNG